MLVVQRRTIRRDDGTVVSIQPWLSPDIVEKIDLRRAPAAAMSASANVIKHLLSTIRLCKFKIGLTGEPDLRWYQGTRGQYYSNFDNMYLLHACLTLEGAKYLECHLIQKFWDEPYCVNRENIDFGGTGKAKDDHGLFYVYVVVVDCGKPPEEVKLVFHRPNLLAQLVDERHI